MRMNQGGGIEGSLVGLGKEDENCRQIIKNSSCLYRKSQTLNCLQKKFKHLLQVFTWRIEKY